MVYCIQLRACILHLQPLYSAADCAVTTLQCCSLTLLLHASYFWLPVFTTFININFDVKDHDLGPPYYRSTRLFYIDSSCGRIASRRIQRCRFIWETWSVVWCQSSQGLRVILARSLSQLSHHDELTLTAALQHCSMQLHTPINIFDTFLCNPDTRHAGAARHTQRGADGPGGEKEMVSVFRRAEGGRGINQIRESRILDNRVWS